MTKPVRAIFLAACAMLIPTLTLAADEKKPTSAGMCPMIKIEAQRLPDLNIARSHHAILNVGGEPTVIGGHSLNFKPTPTAEYFKDGRWHVVQMAYSHDGGVALKLSSGKVLVAGGFEKEMGIGQSWGAELYDPATRTFEGIAALDKKRTLASGTEIDSGRVVISGNWYADDAIGLYDGRHTFSHVKDVSLERVTPYILRTAKDDVIVFGHTDNKGQVVNTAMADCLRGEPHHIPLLEQWKTISFDHNRDMSASFIGNEEKGDYTYLLPATNAENWQNIRPQQDSIVILRVHNGEFSLLPTDYTIPTMTEKGPIGYYSFVLADRERHKAYMLGFEGPWQVEEPRPARVLVLSIDYGVSPARLQLGYTEPITDVDIFYPVLTADGNLMLAGGICSSNNFKSFAGVWLLRMADGPSGPKATAAPFGRWLWPIVFLAVALLCTLTIWKKKSRNKQEATVENASADQPTAYIPDTLLMERICQLMETQKPYLDHQLKLTDVAAAVGSNRTAVSNCINRQRGCTFSQFINDYRITHAKQLMSSQPNLKISEVWMTSGFNTESSFFRAFKAVTGMTPAEWRQQP